MYSTLLYPEDRQKMDKKHDHLNKQQAVATQLRTQFKQKLDKIII